MFTQIRFDADSFGRLYFVDVFESDCCTVFITGGIFRTFKEAAAFARGFAN